jgi:hypothetical protein
MRLATSRMQTLHALAASCMQSRQFFASTLREQLFELKNEDAIKKSKNLRANVLAKAYPLTLCIDQSSLVRQFLSVKKLGISAYILSQDLGLVRIKGCHTRFEWHARGLVID